MTDVASLPFNVEAMLSACVPGGSSCDPQAIADAIREYVAARSPAPSAGVGVEAVRSVIRSMREYPHDTMHGVWADALETALQHPAAPSVSPAVEGDGLPDEHEVRRLQSCEQAWKAVLDAIRKVAPGWNSEEGDNAMERACNAIHRLASSAPQGEAYPTGSDREVLTYLMQQFDSESWECPRCGHSEDCATMDSADYLRRYLSAAPSRPAVDEVAIKSAYEAWCLPRMSNIEPDHPSDAFRAGYIAALAGKDGA